MDRIDILWNIEQIKQLKARYFRFLDTRDQEAYFNLFDEDLELIWTDENGHVFHQSNSRDELRQWLTSTRAEARSRGQAVHHGLTCEITVHDEENASGIWSTMVGPSVLPAWGAPLREREGAFDSVLGVQNHGTCLPGALPERLVAAALRHAKDGQALPHRQRRTPSAAPRQLHRGVHHLSAGPPH
ncbi:nuclear transport factor 2 family protein [Georgenia sp. AZ-5]|uniref:nuclear transport factor 2 family protein n=1 Tax=Georgenia sp. AZ-5 TaxID=3367526 RepID=UPI0037552EF7